MKINCFTCKYGYNDERLGIPMCHHPRRFSEDCVNFNMYEEKEIEESEKPIIPITVTVLDKDLNPIEITTEEKPMEQEKEVKPCHRTRKRLAEWSKTPEGKESYEKVAEEMRKKIISNDLEEAANKFAVFYDQGTCDGIAQDCFIAGAKWQKEQMMGEAIEATLDNTAYPTRLWFNTYLSEYSNNDKVRIIIVKGD